MGLVDVKMCKLNYQGELFMKLKLFALLFSAFIVSGCGLTDKIGGADSLLVDDSFREIPTHDHIDCRGSCTVKVYNRN